MRAPWWRRGAVLVLGAAGLALTACGPTLPASVVAGSTVRVGWSGDLTSLNAGTVTGATRADLDVATLTRSRFARLVDGHVVVDRSFGKVRVLDDDDASFTVRYDLHEVRWSDGVPVDAADLVLAWAAGSNALTPHGFAASPTGLRHSVKVPRMHEFARSIDVRFTQPVPDWQTALDVALPAHVVGQEALGVEDPMEAKQAVLDAVTGHDSGALARIVKVWNAGFDLPGKGTLPTRLLVSDGPYRVESVKTAAGGLRHVRLVANGRYDGTPTPSYEHIDLVPGDAAGQLADLGLRLDIVQLAPTAANWAFVRERERRDFGVDTEHDGTMWVLALRGDRGVFARRDARIAFLRAVPAGDLAAGGAGPWRQAYKGTSSLLFSPGSTDYGIATEDNGFLSTFKGAGAQADIEMRVAGLRPGTVVCTRFDHDSAFARGAYAALRSSVAEAGWSVRDCGSTRRGGAARSGAWDAVITAVPIPTSPEEVAQQWGGRGSRALSGLANPARDRLIATYARTADPYDVRDLRVRIEATLVSDAIVLPIAVQPRVTVSDRDLEGVSSLPGRDAPVTYGAAGWSPKGG